MRFMNDYDIEVNARRHANHPIKATACRIVRDLMNLTNEVSDGWPYWSKPARSAAGLMALIEDKADPTAADLRKALGPIKAMLTKNATTFARTTTKLDLEVR